MTVPTTLPLDLTADQLALLYERGITDADIEVLRAGKPIDHPLKPSVETYLGTEVTERSPRSRVVVDALGNLHDDHTGQFTAKGSAVGDWSQIETVKDFRGWFEARGVKTQISLKAKPAYLRTVAKAFDRFSQRFPVAARGLRTVETSGSMPVTTMAEFNWDKDKVSLSHNWYTDANATPDGYLTFSAAVRGCAQTGWHPPGSDDISSVMWHELGHLLDSHYTAGAGGLLAGTDFMDGHPSRYADGDSWASTQEKFAEYFVAAYYAPVGDMPSDVRAFRSWMDTLSEEQTRAMSLQPPSRYPGQPRDEIGRFATTGGSKAPVNEGRHAVVLSEYGPELDRLAAKHGMTRAEYTAAANARMKEMTSTAQVRVRVPPYALLHILEDGRFKSQFESMTSKGYNDPSFRSNREQDMFGYGQDLPLQQRPIYGYAASAQLGTQEPFLDMYGSAIVWLKDSARDRTSVTWCDSLSDGNQPMPLLEPDVSALPSSFMNPTSGGAYKMEKFDTLRDPLEWKAMEDGSLGYVEAQIHGGVSIDDIAAVEWAPFGYEINPPYEALQILKAEGIPYRYRTYDPAVPVEPWTNGPPERELPVKPEPYQQWPSQRSPASRVVDAHGNIHDEHTGEFTAKGGSEAHPADLQAAIEGWVYGGRAGCTAIRESIASGTPTVEARTLLDALSREKANAPVLYRGFPLMEGGAETLFVTDSEIDLNLSSFSSSRERSDSFLDTGNYPPPTAQAVRLVLSGGSQSLDLVEHGPVDPELPKGVTGSSMIAHEQEWITGGRFHIDYVRPVPDPWGPDRPGGGNDYTVPTWEVGLTQVAVIR